MKKLISILMAILMLASCGYDEPALEKTEDNSESVSSESEVLSEEPEEEQELPEIPEEKPEIPEEPDDGTFFGFCVDNFICHESDLVFEATLPENWTYKNTIIYYEGNKVAECYMRCGKTYEEWRKSIDPSAVDKEIEGRVFSVFSYEWSMVNEDIYGNTEMNLYELSEYEYHNGNHLYRFVLFENKDYNEEFTEEFEKMLGTLKTAKGMDSGYIEKDGRISGIIHPAVPYSPEREEAFENETVPFSMAVPKGWKAEAIEKDGKIFNITFAMPWNEVIKTDVVVIKDSGTTYDECVENNSFWVGINEHTYHEVSGNFSKGSYIRFDYPRKNFGDDEDTTKTYSRFYQLQFDGYVVSAQASIRLDDEWEAFEEDEMICDEFISSIKIG